MSKNVIACLLAGVLFLVLGLWAEPVGGGRKPPEIPIIQALDANGDGVIDAGEIANASAALKTLDKNGDGKLTRDEIMPSPPNGGRGGPPGGGNGEPPSAPQDGQ